MSIHLCIVAQKSWVWHGKHTRHSLKKMFQIVPPWIGKKAIRIKKSQPKRCPLDTRRLLSSGIIRITLWARGVEGAFVGGVEREAFLQATREIGVREERHAVRDGIGPALGDGLLGLRAIEAAGGDEHALEVLAELLGADAVLGAVRDVLGGDAGNVRIGELELGELAEDVAKSFGRVGVGHVVEHAAGREADAHAIGTPDGDDGFGDLDGQAGAGGEGVAVAIGAGVGATAEELVEQVAVGVMDLDAVETGFLGEAGALDVFGDDAGDLLDAKRTGNDVVGHLLAGPDLALGLDGGRGDGQFAVRLVVRVRNATDMPELQEDAAALGVDCGCDLLPARDLFVGIDARGVRIAMAAGRDCGGLGDDQARAGALGVVFGHQVRRDIGALGAATSQRCH